MTVYLDIILFENMCMNYIMLFTTGIIRKTKINQKKLMFSSAIGSMYAIIIYLNIMNFASNIIMKILLSISMVWVAFNAKNFKNLFKDLLMFYLISFIFGGCSFALIYFINPSKVKMKNGVLVGLYPVKITLIAGIIAFFVTQIAFKMTKGKLSIRDMICDVKVKYNNKTVKLRTLIDSGNMLKDPISEEPVMIVEKEKLKDIMPKEMLDIINKIEGGDVIERFDRETKIRLIPFSSLGMKNGMLVGIKVDDVEINYRENWKKVDNIILGIYENKITKDNLYNALIGIDVVEIANNVEIGPLAK